MELDLQIERKGVFFTNRPVAYILIVLVAVIAVAAGKLRMRGIFACQADGYTADSYLAYCNGTEFGDYEHGALWFDLEPSVKAFARAADVIFLGDSHIQFAFSTPATSEWFSAHSESYYLLGFIYGENVSFEEKILSKTGPRAKVYIIAANFFERIETVPARDVMHDQTSRYRYQTKYLWQIAHKYICQTLSIICGHQFAIFRSQKNGTYQKSGRTGGPLENSPVSYEHDINQDKIRSYAASGRSFLSQLPVPKECIILTTIPTVRAHAFAYASSVETVEAVAKELGVVFVSPVLDNLRTFDGSHLDQSSAERWSKTFFHSAESRILKCTKDLKADRSFNAGSN